MKDQVTSIEQSKRLIELGVPTEKASMVWEYWINQDFSKDPSEEVFYNLNTKANRQIDPSDRDVPAFTVADLLGLIKPIHIFENLWCPCIERTRVMMAGCSNTAACQRMKISVTLNVTVLSICS